MKKGILAVLIFTLLTGCASSQKAVPTMSEEDYYLVTYRNINNIGIFQFGNEETGMATLILRQARLFVFRKRI